jgi:predicted transcriptional regulator
MKDIFIVELVDGDIVACYKETIEESIKDYENSDTDIDWETIAKVKGIFANMDITAKHIDWYKDTPDEKIQNKALFSIIQLIKNG